MTDLPAALGTLQQGSGDREVPFCDFVEHYDALLDAQDGSNVALCCLHRIMATVKRPHHADIRQQNP